MRVVTLVLFATLIASAEFLRIEVTFEDIGCASCVESLQGRLARVRGVEKVEVDAEKRLATLHLEPGNQVRLAPLLARITQDGTKVTRVAVRAKGAIDSAQDGLVFRPSALTDLYRLHLPAESAINPRPGAIYAIEGTVDGAGIDRGPILKAASAVEIR